MIEEYAVVTARMEGHVLLEIERRTACGLCGQTRGCGNATWGKLLGHTQQTFAAENLIDANVGDSVVVGIDERAMLGAVFYMYVVPLLTMLIAAIVADALAENQFYVVIAAISGLLLGFLWTKGHLAGFGNSHGSLARQCRAKLLRRADTTTACNHSIRHE